MGWVYFFTQNNKHFMFVKDINYCTVCSKTDEGLQNISDDAILSYIGTDCDREFVEKLLLTYHKQPKREKLARQHSVYTLCLHPSRRCNLKCKYCFADESDYLPKSEISFDVVKDALRFLTESYGPEAVKYNVDISGSGEPLLRFDFIKQLSEYCRELNNQINKDIYITFPTNATLLTKEKAEYLDNAPNILPGVSLDGDAMQSANRVYPTGKPSFEDAVKGAKLFQHSFGIAVTVTNINEDVDRIYDYLYHEFPLCDCISIQQVRNFETNDPCSFNQINIENMLKHYDLLVENMIDRYIQEDDIDYILKIMRGADYFGKYIYRILHTGTVVNKRCGAADSSITVDAKGDLYACSVMNGDPSFRIGNIYSGVDDSKAQQFYSNNVDNNRNCKACWIASICGGECHVKAWYTHRDFTTPNGTICTLKREWVKRAIYFTETIKQLDYEKYMKLKNFEIDPTVSDTSIWTIRQFLEMHQISADFQELNGMVRRSRNGVPVKELARVLDQYGVQLEAFQITDPDILRQLKYPAIGFQNKNLKFYRYFLIIGVEDDTVICKDISLSDTIRVPAAEFVENISSFVLCKG